MNRQEFCVYALPYFKRKLRELPTLKGINFERLSASEVERILNLSLEILLRAIQGGEDVKLSGFGTFFPRIIRSRGHYRALQLSFEAFPHVNEALWSEFRKRPIAKLEALPDKVAAYRIVTVNPTVPKVVDPTGRELYSLVHIASLAGIRTVTARHYLRRFPGKIPVVENGRREKYPIEVAEIFKRLKSANTARVQGSEPPQIDLSVLREDKYYTLAAVAILTKISQATLSKYLLRFSNEIRPTFVGTQRRRYFTARAIRKIVEIRQRNHRESVDISAVL